MSAHVDYAIFASVFVANFLFVLRLISVERGISLHSSMTADDKSPSSSLSVSLLFEYEIAGDSNLLNYLSLVVESSH